MRNAGGYVKVFRSMLDWQWYQDDACARIMLHLLLMVNREAKEWKGQVVKPGQLITSMDRIADDLRLTRSAVRRALDKMKASGEVTIQTNNHWTTVTLANWAEYQEPDQPVSQPKANQRPTTGRPVSRPPATTEEVEKERSKEEPIAPGGAVVELVWPSWAGPKTRETWEAFKAHKKAHHGFRYKTIASEQAAIDILGRYYPDGKTCVAGLTEAMAKGYKFPIDPAKEIHANGRADVPQQPVKPATGFASMPKPLTA